MGCVYLWQKHYEQALAEMEQVIALDPDVAFGYAPLAEVLSRVGRTGEVMGMVEKALRPDPASGLTYYWYFYSLGSAYYLAGRTEEAIAPLQRLLTQYPNQGLK